MCSHPAFEGVPSLCLLEVSFPCLFRRLKRELWQLFIKAQLVCMDLNKVFLGVFPMENTVRGFCRIFILYAAADLKIMFYFE